MQTRQSTVDNLLDRLAGAGNLSTRRMFGGYCLYLEGTPVGLIFRDQCFVKWTEAGRAALPDLDEGHPFPGSRPYLVVPADDLDGWERRVAVARLLRVTLDALPPHRPRPRGRGRARAAD